MVRCQSQPRCSSVRSFFHQYSELYVLSFPREGDLESYDIGWWVRCQDESRKHPSCRLTLRHSTAVSGLFSGTHSRVSGWLHSITRLSLIPSLLLVQVVSKMSSCLPVHQNGDAQGASRPRLGDSWQASPTEE